MLLMCYGCRVRTPAGWHWPMLQQSHPANRIIRAVRCAHPNLIHVLNPALLRAFDMQMETFLLPASGYHPPACLPYARQLNFGVSAGKASQSPSSLWRHTYPWRAE